MVLSTVRLSGSKQIAGTSQRYSSVTTAHECALNPRQRIAVTARVAGDHVLVVCTLAEARDLTTEFRWLRYWVTAETAKPSEVAGGACVG